METLQSHVLHLYFLVAPDFLNAGSVFPLIDSHPDVVQRAAKMKLLANDLCDCVGGRRMHPTRTVVGGFTMLPEKKELLRFKMRLKDAQEDLLKPPSCSGPLQFPISPGRRSLSRSRAIGNIRLSAGTSYRPTACQEKEQEYRADDQ